MENLVDLGLFLGGLGCLLRWDWSALRGLSLGQEVGR
jgi:hypothetical protein